MNIQEDCLILDNGNKYCNNPDASLKTFVKSIDSDWKEVFYPNDYLMQHLDRILVTYGAGREEAINKQIESVTDESKNY